MDPPNLSRISEALFVETGDHIQPFALVWLCLL